MRLQIQTRDVPLVLRLAGCWLLWSAWCSASGLLLSAVRQLDSPGYAILLPVLLGCLWHWLKITSPVQSTAINPAKKILRRLRRPAALVYVAVALLSLLAGFLYAPWGSDAVNYRLPRILYWWSAHHWYWIGTLDHRLDYNSVGFEWQMLPVIELTRSDRFLFLLNWLPFLLMPGLVFKVFRALGVNGRSARRWMWLLPCGYCFALQCSGLQNDGYTVNYLLVSILFAVAGFHARRTGLLLMSVLAAALLTGAKLSNLPLLLPLAFFWWPTLRHVRWLDWKVPVVLAVALFCSFAPLTFFCWKNTGDWAGDPADQWNIKTHGVAGAAIANAVILLNDAAQLPCLPASQHLEIILNGFNHSPFVSWLKQSHWQFNGVHFGEMAYEGGAGLGFGVAIYTLFLILGGLFVPTRATSSERGSAIPFEWRMALWLAWVSYFVFLAKLGSSQSARIAAPYYPLLFVTLLRHPRVVALERKKIAGVFAGAAAATVLPVIFLTPARPLIPIQTLAAIIHRPAMEKIAAQYRLWDNLHDDLAPLRAQLPADAVQLGYAGSSFDTPYDLCKPPGRRAIVELGLPPGSGKLPSPDLKYAVVTEAGLQERYQLNLKTWLDRTRGQVVFEFQRNMTLDAHSGAQVESWYLVKFAPASAN